MHLPQQLRVLPEKRQQSVRLQTLDVRQGRPTGWCRLFILFVGFVLLCPQVKRRTETPYIHDGKIIKINKWLGGYTHTHVGFRRHTVPRRRWTYSVPAKG